MRVNSLDWLIEEFYKLSPPIAVTLTVRTWRAL